MKKDDTNKQVDAAKHSQLPTPKEINESYKRELIPGLRLAEKIVRNPGGILFTTQALKAVGLDLSNLKATDEVMIGQVKVTGETLKLVVAYYDFLEDQAYKLGCMDPRPNGFDKISRSCMHHECGAANLVSQMTLNGRPVFSHQTGQKIEQQLVRQLNTPYLDLIAGTTGGHRDSGVVLVLNKSVLIDDEVQKRLIEKNMGGAYVLTLDRDLIAQYIRQLKKDEQKQINLTQFIDALVDLNLAIALDIATSNHNKIDITKSGFRFIVVNASKNPSEIETKIKQRVEQLIKEKLTDTQVYQYQIRIN